MNNNNNNNNNNNTNNNNNNNSLGQPIIASVSQNQETTQLSNEQKQQLLDMKNYQKFGKEGLPIHLGALGPQKRNSQGKKTLVLDLDETLVHSSFKAPIKPDIILPVEIEGNVCNVFVLVRPGTEFFLQRLSKYYELVIYTASLSKYAEPLIDILDNKKEKVIDYRLFREHCTFFQGVFIKDMSLLGRPLADAIIIDNSPTSYIFHQENALPILSWYEDQKDRCLFELIPLLESLAEVDDVRKYIPRFVTTDHKVDFQRACQLLANAQPKIKPIKSRIIEEQETESEEEANQLKKQNKNNQKQIKPQNDQKHQAQGIKTSSTQRDIPQSQINQIPSFVSAIKSQALEVITDIEEQNSEASMLKQNSKHNDQEGNITSFNQINSQQHQILMNTWTIDKEQDQEQNEIEIKKIGQEQNKKPKNNTTPKKKKEYEYDEGRVEIAQDNREVKVEDIVDNQIANLQQIKKEKKEKQNQSQVIFPGQNIDQSQLNVQNQITPKGINRQELKGSFAGNNYYRPNSKEIRYQQQQQREQIINQIQGSPLNITNLKVQGKKQKQSQQYFSRTAHLQALLQTDKIMKKTHNEISTYNPNFTQINTDNLSSNNGISVQSKTPQEKLPYQQRDGNIQLSQPPQEQSSQSIIGLTSPKQAANYIQKFFPTTAGPTIMNQSQLITAQNSEVNTSRKQIDQNSQSLREIEKTQKQVAHFVNKGRRLRKGISENDRLEQSQQLQQISQQLDQSQEETKKTAPKSALRNSRHGGLGNGINLINKRRQNSRQQLIINNTNGGSSNLKLAESNLNHSQQQIVLSSNISAANSANSSLQRPTSAKKPLQILNNIKSSEGNSLIHQQKSPLNNSFLSGIGGQYTTSQKLGGLFSFYDINTNNQHISPYASNQTQFAFSQVITPTRPSQQQQQRSGIFRNANRQAQISNSLKK